MTPELERKESEDIITTMTREMTPKRKNQDVLVTITNFNQLLGTELNHVVTYQIKRKYLPKIKRLLKESYHKENL